MKLTPEIRAAVKAAVSQQKTRKSEYQIANEHLTEWLKTPAANRVNKLLRQHEKLSEKARAISNELNRKWGLNAHGGLWDTAAFYKAAKVTATESSQLFTEMQVLAELAQAKPDQASAILSKYGINWE